MTTDNTLNNPAAATAPASEATAAPETVETQTPGEAETPKTFTQEELDKIVAKEKAKAERKLRRELMQAQEQNQAPTAPPKREQFSTPEDYAEALADFKVQQKMAEREQQKQQRESKSAFEEREDEARSKYPDYKQVAYSDDVRITPEMADAIFSSDVGPEIAYWLGKNIDESYRISKLSPLAQAREIGKIEASLNTANPPAKKPSSAPEPIKPLGGSRAASQSYPTTDPRSAKTMSASEWIDAENARQMKKLRP